VVSCNILARAHGDVGYLQPRGRILSPHLLAAFEGLPSMSYIFYQYIVATLVIVVAMVIGDVFPQKFYEFILTYKKVTQILIA